MQAHIHFGQRHTVGGIVVWLCQSATNPAPDPTTPQCPATSGTVSGTITAAQVVTVTGQGIDAGQFAELLAAIRAGATYANVHSATFGPGEIRGQIRPGRGHRD
jgi:CHRD domain